MSGRILGLMVAIFAGMNFCWAQSIFPDSFNPGVSGGQMTNLAIQADGRILICGDFTMAGGQFRNGLARLHAEGSLDQNFDAQVSGGPVNALAIQADGKIVIAGGFQWVGGQMRFGLARLHANGALDTGFNVEVSGGPVTALAIQPDGKLVLGGGFNWVGGQFRAGLARLDSNGALDANFTPSVSGGAVAVLAMQPDGKILVGGSFNSLAGQFRDGIGRLNADGTPDGNFNGSATGGAVQSLALQPDGKILVGGSFTTLNGQSREYFGRLTPEGNLEGQFGAAVSGGQVASLALQADGKILLAGAFTSLGGQTREGMGRLNADGNLDFSFSTSVAGGTVSAVALQTDGNILLGGSFSTLSGQTRNGIGRLDNPDIATQSLNYNATSATWLRGGASPEISLAVFDRSADGLTWVSLGAGTRIAGGWQLAGFNLPAGQTVRSRGYVSPGNWYVDYMRGPEITSQPTNQIAVFGRSATFSVSVTGLGLAYQWWKDGAPLFQGTNAALTLTNLLLADAGQYSVVVSNTYGSVTSAVASLTVERVAITTQPVSQNRSVGQSASFFVAAEGNNLRYQWWKNGQPLASRTNAAFTLLDLNVSDEGQYWVVVSNSYITVTSSVAILTIEKFRLLSQPLSQSVNVGQTAIFTVTADGPDLRYQWFKDGLAIALKTNAMLTLSNVQPTDMGLYSVLVTNQYGSALSSVVELSLGQAAVDLAFNAGTDSFMRAMAVQPDGIILVGGPFRSLAGQACVALGRLHSDGTLDDTFKPQFGGANPDVYAVAIQPDGRILAGGQFTTVGGQPHTNIVRLLPDGSVDPTFNQHVSSGLVYAFALQPDGKIVIGGNFTNVAGGTNNAIARLNPDGSRDTGFVAATFMQDSVSALAVLPDGKIVLSGYLLGLNGSTRRSVGRLDADGVLDSTFNPPIPIAGWPLLLTMAVQPNGQVLVGGGYSTVTGPGRGILKRINANGSLDTNFVPVLDNLVGSIALQTDGKIIIGGQFTTIDTHVRRGVARLNYNGTLDPNFVFDIPFGWGDPMVLQPNGQLVVAGNFSMIGGQSRTNLARINNNTPGSQMLVYGTNSTVTWRRGGGTPEFRRATLEYASVNSGWIMVGAGIHRVEGWQWDSSALPDNAVVRLRGYGLGQGNADWFVESIHRPFSSARPIIHNNDGGLGVVAGRFGFNVQGQPGQVLVMERSSDLRYWSPVSTNALINNQIRFEDPNWRSQFQGNYRVRVWP